MGVKGGGIGWWEGGLCERFVLRWLLLLIYKRQAGKAHFLVYLGERQAQRCFLRTHLILRCGTAACGRLGWSLC